MGKNTSCQFAKCKLRASRQLVYLSTKTGNRETANQLRMTESAYHHL